MFITAVFCCMNCNVYVYLNSVSKIRESFMLLNIWNLMYQKNQQKKNNFLYTNIILAEAAKINRKWVWCTAGPLLCCKACSLSGFQKEEVSLVIPVLANAFQLQGSQRQCDFCFSWQSLALPCTHTYTLAHTFTHTHTHSHPSRLPPPLLESVWASHSGVFITFTQVHPYLSPRAALIALTMCPTGNLSHLLMRDPRCAQGRYLENAVFKEIPIIAISQWEISYWLMRKIHNNAFDMVAHS